MTLEFISGASLSYEELCENGERAKQAAYSVASDIVKDCRGDFEKARAIHDYIASVCEYDGEMDELSYTALGALGYGKAVCQGYSAAFNLLCRCAGLRSLAVSNDSHMWNVVLIDGDIYHYDVTYDDGDVILHEYCGVKDEGTFSDEAHSGFTLPKKEYFYIDGTVL